MDKTPTIAERIAAIPARQALQPYRSRPMGMLLVGLAAAAALAIWGIYLYFVFTAPDALHGPVDEEGSYRDYTITAGFFAFVAGWVVGALLSDRGFRMMQPDAWAAMEHDGRPPVIFLRPFVEDNRKTYDQPIGQRIGGLNGAVAAGTRASLENKLVHAFGRLGPFIAVGIPGEKLAPIGAPRLYLAHDDWRNTVEALVSMAGAIVLQPDEQASVEWELNLVTHVADLRRVLMIVPNPARRPIGYARVRAITAPYLRIPLPGAPGPCDAFMFDMEGAPMPILVGDKANQQIARFVEQASRLPQPTLKSFAPAAPDRSLPVQPTSPAARLETAKQAPGIAPAATPRLGRFLSQFRARIDRGYLYRYLLITLVAALFTVLPAIFGNDVDPGLKLVLLLAFLGWLGFAIYRVIQRAGFKTNHPLALVLARQGDLASVADDIEKDLGPQSVWGKTVVFGERWIVHIRGHQFSVQRLSDIVWAHAERFRESFNGIPYRFINQIVMWNRFGFAGVAPMPKPLGVALLRYLNARMPWLPLGYSETLKESWNADRRDFIATVDYQAQATKTGPEQEAAILDARAQLSKAQEAANISTFIQRLALFSALAFGAWLVWTTLTAPDFASR